MSIAKKSKLLLCLVSVFALVFCLIGCGNVTESPELAAKKLAETHAQEVLNKIIFGDEDRTAITSSLNLHTSNKNYPDVTISWSSSEEDIINPENGRVTRPYENDERVHAVSDAADAAKVADVVLTATVTASYSYGKEGQVVNETTEPVSKQFNFTVLAIPEGTDVGTIKEVKDRAWNYIYVEQGVEKALVSNSKVVYNVFITGVVTAELQADGSTKGFAMHDGTDGIYVYGDNTKVQVGDYVEVIGEVYSYYGNLQVGSNVSVSKIATGNYELPEHRLVTPQEWEDETKDLGDEIIGRIGAQLIKVEGYLTAKKASAGSGKYCIVDALTGEESWIYYKSYTEEMEEQLKANVDKYVVLSGVSYDRDSRIVKNELLWTGEIEEKAAPQVDDQTKANVELSKISLESEYSESFELSNLATWEVVSGTGVEIKDGKAVVTQTSAEQTVVLKATVTVGEATASKEFTIVIPSLTIEVTDLATAAELGAAAGDAYTETSYYVLGTITEIANATYGNVYITDGTNSFYVYSIYINGKKYGEAEVKPVVGETVLLQGKLGAYKGTAQMKNADLIAYEPGTTFETVSSEEANKIGSDLEAGKYTEDKYFVKGIVTEVANATYGNVYIKDILGNEFYVYGIYSADGETRFDKLADNQPKVGDFVVLEGVLGNYNKAPQMKNGWLVQLNNTVLKSSEPTPEPVYKEVTIAEALKLEDGALVKIAATVKEVNGEWSDQYNNMNVTIEDATGTLYVFRLATKVKVGDKVVVSGKMDTYNEARQIAQGATAEVEKVEEPAKEVTIAEALELEDDAKVILNGTLVVLESISLQSGAVVTSGTLKDATGEIYVYQLAGEFAQGDQLTVEGVLDTYNNARQIAKGAKATLKGHDATYDPVAPTVPTALFNNYKNATLNSDATQLVWKENGITVTNDQAESKTACAVYCAPARFYQNSNLTIAYEKAFTKVLIYLGSGNKLEAAPTIEGATAAIADGVLTVEFATAVSSFTITNLAKQLRVAKLEIAA